ncbi:sulfoxide reductase heme-binding subunit YedZ [Aliiglaciecola sp. CAU 1673]|uniref:protein-methionine-sulfoxide reductase heme-binding subunit MsrQ n=1 Tax=Aliiglaciecola sp. CAU 1673 TaxID=3032595 RepID=UPI0023DCCE3A|nr:protein-methionine-sulfoxide reductase heme-binding subunit MsrQ [Aliiglaciecola sp. CAU 1673]MDF2178445.1 sulfoxide reductase heme-binding subunit YedZ [Aliiglaciecola sp. CAU 1673]
MRRVSFSSLQITLLKALIHISCLGTALWFYYQATLDNLGGDPVEEILHFTGISTLNMLLLSLAMSPLAKALRQAQFIRFRRLLGLYAFFFAVLHLGSYILFELQLEWSMLLSEIIERPYITVGFAAWLILLTMTLTSTQTIQRKMGKAWQKVHNGVYLTAALIGLHYMWSVKTLTAKPMLYLGLLMLALWLRRDKIRRWLF